MIVPLVDLKAQYGAIREEIHRSIEGVLEKQKFILDDEVSLLEEQIACLCGTRFAVGCASGTDALLLALLTLGIGEGDEVITTSYSFFSTAGMIAWLKAKPVFVDIDRRTFNLRPELVPEKITSKTKAIIAVHLFGQCSRIEELKRLDLPVIEDAAQAIGAARNGNAAGSLGAIGCFSFFPTKNLGAYGDGGMVTTNDAAIAAQIRKLRVHGQESQPYSHPVIGTNSRLDELQAAILRVKLQYLNEWNQKRRSNAEFYTAHLRDLPLRLPQTEPGNLHTFHQFVIQTDARDRLKTYLMDKGIGTAIYYPVPLPHQPCFSQLGYRHGDFPEAESCAAGALALPIHPELSQQQLEYVAFAIQAFFH